MKQLVDHKKKKEERRKNSVFGLHIGTVSSNSIIPLGDVFS